MDNREVTLTTADLVSVQEAAIKLGRPRITIYRWIAKGRILSIKFGGIYYIPTSELDRLQKQTDLARRSNVPIT